MTEVPPAPPSPLDEVCADIRKRLDDPSVIYNLHEQVKAFPALSSGIGVIDDALFGGLPVGRIIELYGSEGSGKTTVALHFMASAQQKGYVVFFVDAECALDIPYAMRIGVRPKEMLFSQPDYGEQAFMVMESIFDSLIHYNENHSAPMKALIVIDSVPALVPKIVFERKLDEVTIPGVLAALLSQNLPTICSKASKSGATVCFINQIREKIGVMFGSPLTTPGGRALKFYASVRLNISRVGLRKKGEVPVAIKSELIPAKSKLYPIWGRKAVFYIGPDGIDEIAALADMCLEKKVFAKSGAWLKYGDINLQGLARWEDAIRADPDLEKQLRAALCAS
jgi:recombination protein RecA